MSRSTPLLIDLWFWHLDAPACTLARWQTYLDQAEQDRMERFMFARDKIRFTICRSRLRRILGQYTHTAPRAIKFATEGRGKPVLAGANPNKVHFNLTHTEGLACLAVAHGEAVGVDLEHMRAVKDDFVTYALNPAEHAGVQQLPPADRQAAFFRVWTAKEAYLKSIGTGLWQSLKTFDVEMPHTPARGSYKPGHLPRVDDENDRVRNWHLLTFQPTEAHIGALAVAPETKTDVRIRARWLGMNSGKR